MHGSGSGDIVRVDDTESPERVPSARLVVTPLELKMNLAGICVLSSQVPSGCCLDRSRWIPSPIRESGGSPIERKRARSTS